MPERRFDEALSGLATGTAEAAAAAAPRGAAADATSHPSVVALRARFGDAMLHHTIVAGDEHVVFIAPARSREILHWLHQDEAQRYDLLADLTAVDYGGGRPLEVVYQLWSVPHRRALRVKAALPLAALEVDSVVEIWRAADWLEREVYDMFGVHFRGHPDLRRILMPDNYAEGHPLRKDFPLRGRFSRAEQTRRALTMSVEDFYTPDELEVGGAVVTMPDAQSVTRADAGGAAPPPAPEGAGP
ncbi:MAG TPA: NADH-quinone oxidoreductase subunit C [Longimicrobiales bacterium]|nr:NADH-quinone oxidoreductase subunit C [Longimicrobiales bacterium]